MGDVACELRQLSAAQPELREKLRQRLHSIRSFEEASELPTTKEPSDQAGHRSSFSLDDGTSEPSETEGGSSSSSSDAEPLEYVMLAAAAKLPAKEAAKLLSGVRRLERRAERRRGSGASGRSSGCEMGQPCAADVGEDGQNCVEPPARSALADPIAEAAAETKSMEADKPRRPYRCIHAPRRPLVALLMALLAPAILGLFGASSESTAEAPVEDVDVTRPVASLSAAERRARERAFERAVAAATEQQARQAAEHAAERLSRPKMPVLQLKPASEDERGLTVASHDASEREDLEILLADAGITGSRMQQLSAAMAAEGVSVKSLREASHQDLARLLASPSLAVASKERLALLRKLRASR